MKRVLLLFPTLLILQIPEIVQTTRELDDEGRATLHTDDRSLGSSSKPFDANATVRVDISLRSIGAGENLKTFETVPSTKNLGVSGRQSLEDDAGSEIRDGEAPLFDIQPKLEKAWNEILYWHEMKSVQRSRTLEDTLNFFDGVAEAEVMMRQARRCMMNMEKTPKTLHWLDPPDKFRNGSITLYEYLETSRCPFFLEEERFPEQRIMVIAWTRALLDDASFSAKEKLSHLTKLDTVDELLRDYQWQQFAASIVDGDANTPPWSFKLVKTATNEWILESTMTWRQYAKVQLQRLEMVALLVKGSFDYLDQMMAQRLSFSKDAEEISEATQYKQRITAEAERLKVKYDLH